MRKTVLLLALLFFFPAAFARATVFGQIEGVVHDSQHRPIAGAQITIRSSTSELTLTTRSGADGLFRFLAVPFGDYSVNVAQPGFVAITRDLTLASGTSPILHFELAITGDKQTVEVTASAANPDTVTPTTLIRRADIAETPGADRPYSMQMITDYVPGAYMTHDMLHMRGGHQVSWLIDGVQIPNTNIASNVGPQIDPNDIDYLETQRGSYAADVSDRTYGVFNVAPLTGFERNRQGELRLSAGNFFSGNGDLSLGNHTRRFAWYTSFNGNRTDYGLAPPVGRVLHDAANGYGGFASFVYNCTPKDQLRAVTQVRSDYFQIPYDPDPISVENTQYQSAYLRDGQHESDSFAAFTWTHTFRGLNLLQVSPFYHYNSANYRPKLGDLPVAATSDRASNYAGAQASIGATIARNTIQAGFYSWGQHDSYLLAALFKDQSSSDFRKLAATTGGLIEGYVSDTFKATSWLTFIVGLRQSHFQSQIAENVTAPRIGVAVEVPRMHWVLRGFYGRFYQPPPLLSASGPVVRYATDNSTAIIPLRGERDEEHQFGVQIPLRGWLLDADTFKTRINNFLDHSNLGESSIYFPVTLDGALVRAWEVSLRSPRLWRLGQAHLAYSNQIAEQRGKITGGLVCAPIASPDCYAGFDYSPVDHDQRNTLNLGFNASLPSRITASSNVSYGSGLHNGSPSDRYPGRYLPQHTTFDLSVGKSFHDDTSVTVTALNVANRRVMLDNSLTFGGFHYNDPRQLYLAVRYRFHF